MVAALLGVFALRFACYYDLNDDVLIKDILSGVYSGSPDGHTMQLLYPLGWGLAMLYSVSGAPVFGIFLAVCQYGSIFLIGYRILRLCSGWEAKLAAVLAQAVFWTAAFGYHLVFLQYTVTAGMLAGAALFWMLTRRESQKEGIWDFWSGNFLAVVLYWLSFCLRIEMALLLLPLAGVAGLCRWAWEKSFFTKENVVKYLSVFGSLVLGMAVCLAADGLAYQKDGWPAFRKFFDGRTELYDYQKDFIDNYEENAAAYGALGMARQRQALLENYNFGVDDALDVGQMEALREAALLRPQSGGFFRKSLREGIWSLVYGHWAGRGDFPYNAVLALGSLSVLCLGLVRGWKRLLWQAVLCSVVGAALWMFLLLRDRPVDRVLHPLYLGQILLVLGLLLLAVSKGREGDRADGGTKAGVLPKRPAGRTGHFVVFLTSILAVCFFLPCAGRTYEAVSGEYTRREGVNRANGAMFSYCREHPDTLFLADVYSTVDFSEKISLDRDKPFNYDLLGGWLVKSPLTAKKLSAFGFATMGEAVRNTERVRLFAESGGDMEWLDAYWEWLGIALRVEKEDWLPEGIDVYTVVHARGVS